MIAKSIFFAEKWYFLLINVNQCDKFSLQTQREDHLPRKLEDFQENRHSLQEKIIYAWLPSKQPFRKERLKAHMPGKLVEKHFDDELASGWGWQAKEKEVCANDKAQDAAQKNPRVLSPEISNIKWGKWRWMQYYQSLSSCQANSPTIARHRAMLLLQQQDHRIPLRAGQHQSLQIRWSQAVQPLLPKLPHQAIKIILEVKEVI